MRKFHFFRGLEDEPELILCSGFTISYIQYEMSMSTTYGCRLDELNNYSILEDFHFREPGDDIKSRRNFTKRPTQIKTQPRRNNSNYHRIRSNIRRR